MYAKEFLAIHHEFDELGHVSGGMKKPIKPIIVMTDNVVLTRSFQTKQIPPNLWNFCDQAHQTNFIIAHVPGIEKPAADNLSRLEFAPTDRIHLNLTDPIPIHHIEIDLASQIGITNTQIGRRRRRFPPRSDAATRRTSHPQPTKQDVKAVLLMVTQRDDESNDNYGHRLKLICNHITEHDEDASSDVANCTGFASKRSLHHPAVNQGGPPADHEISNAQVSDVNVRRKIRILCHGEVPPLHSI